MYDNLKPTFDGLSVGTIVATMAGWLPHLAALFSLIWSIIRVYETKTVQGWIKRWKESRE